MGSIKHKEKRFSTMDMGTIGLRFITNNDRQLTNFRRFEAVSE